MTRLRRMGGLFLIGILVIVCIALGALYIQQGARQKELSEQIAKVSLTVAKSLPSAEKLLAEYDEVKRSLSPLTVNEALDIIIGVARESGIEVDPSKGKFRIPPQELKREEKIGESTYRVLSFNTIGVRGGYDDVMAFISNLESGETLKTLVLRKVIMKEIEPEGTGEVEARMAEFQEISLQVKAMMTDNNITEIPNPADYATGVAQIQMEFVSGTPNHGFPDFTTTAAEKGYLGVDTPNPGYVLYNHDKIDPEDTTTYTAVNYVTMAQTKYFYTCEADGTIRQWSASDVATATEYLSSGKAIIETIVTLDIDIYTEIGGDNL